MGLGYFENSHASTSSTVFVKASSTHNSTPTIKEDQQKGKKLQWICHFYGRHRHIRPFCYHLHSEISCGKAPRLNGDQKEERKSVTLH